MTASVLITIITSAAVGATVSAVVTLLGQWMERKHRRRELLLSKAVGMAQRRLEFGKYLADKGRDVALQDEISMVPTYFKELQHIFDTGEQSPELKKIEAASRRKPERVDQ